MISYLKNIGRHKAEAYCLSSLILLSVNPGWFHYGLQRANLLMIIWISLSPLALLNRKARIWIPRIDIPLLILAGGVIAFPLIFHPESVRWSTMLYTCGICIFFMMFARMVKAAHIRRRRLLKLIRWIVIAFAIMLLIQQICVAIGIGIPGRGLVTSKWKLNSLASEASWAAITVSLVMWMYSQCCRILNPTASLWGEITKHPLIWGSFGWIAITLPVISIWVFLPLVFLPWLTKRNVAPAFGILSTIIVIIFIATPIVKDAGFMRAQRIFFATLSFDTHRMYETDQSAASRIAPSIEGVHRAIRPDIETLTGHGVDADQRDLPMVMSWREDGMKGSAGIMKILHNYGLLCCVSLWWIIGSVCYLPGRWWGWLTMAIAFYFSAEFNFQILWMILAFALVIKSKVLGYDTILERWGARR